MAALGLVSWHRIVNELTVIKVHGYDKGLGCSSNFEALPTTVMVARHISIRLSTLKDLVLLVFHSAWQRCSHPSIRKNYNKGFPGQMISLSMPRIENRPLGNDHAHHRKRGLIRRKACVHCNHLLGRVPCPGRAVDSIRRY